MKFQKPYKLLKSVFSDFFALFYPEVCFACNRVLLKHEEVICNFCDIELPKTLFHTMKDNPLEKIFWGRVKLESVSARYYFRKKSKIQRLMHRLKYKGAKEVGIIIGEKYGHELLENPIFRSVNVIVPIPLHPDKERIRGYNQSEMFGIGLSESMNIPQDTKHFLKVTSTESQTKKNRYNRWENVKEIFTIEDEDFFKGKHILLIDDIITTGATIEAAAQMLLKIEGVKVSVVGIAAAGI